MNYYIDTLTNKIQIKGNPIIFTDRKKIRGALRSASGFLIKDYYITNRSFKRSRIYSDHITKTEEKINNEEVYVLKVRYKDTKDTRNSIETFYIRKSDFMPVAYHSTLDWENMNQYEYYEIKYLEINKSDPSEQYKIDGKETENPHKSYEHFMNRFNN